MPHAEQHGWNNESVYYQCQVRLGVIRQLRIVELLPDA